jgi:CRISPR/Cas system-associated endoribonuclease Cas2
MTLYVITYDVRSTNHDYDALYKQLKDWDAAHLQNSVWLADMNGTASAVRDVLKAHMHKDDTVCVVQLKDGTNSWATSHAKQPGVDWLKSRFP